MRVEYVYRPNIPVMNRETGKKLLGVCESTIVIADARDWSEAEEILKAHCAALHGVREVWFSGDDLHRAAVMCTIAGRNVKIGNWSLTLPV